MLCKNINYAARKESRIKLVFKRVLNVDRQPDIATSWGKAFHSAAAMIGRIASSSPMSPQLLLAERNVLVGLYRHRRSVKYFGASLCTPLYVNTHYIYIHI